MNMKYTFKNYNRNSTKLRYFIAGIILLFSVASCSGQQQIISYKGNLLDIVDQGERISESYPFKVEESAFFTITATCNDFDPVLVFHPSEGRGFEWDGAREGILRYTGFFFGPETYDIQIRAIVWDEISDPGFRITIEKPAVKHITPGKTITGDFESECIEYSWYYEVLYYILIDTPGKYSLTVQAEAGVQCSLDGKELLAFLQLSNPGDVETRDVEIKESSIYGISIRYFEKKEGTYSFKVELK